VYFQGRCSLRQLRVLVEHLPPDSALHRAARGHAWGDDTYILAEAADALRSLVALTAAVNSKNGKYKPPQPLPRPGEDADQERDREAEARARHDQLKAKLLPARG
jgi:hypothetical protein